MKKWFAENKNLKKVIAGLLGVVTLQTIVFVSLSYQQNETTPSIKTLTINEKPDSLDYAKVKHNFNQLDKVVDRFSKFLKEKDIKAPHVESLKEANLGDGIYLNGQISSYSAAITQFEEELKKIPLGKPVLSGYISSSFGRRVDPVTRNTGGSGNVRYHEGIDFAVPIGTSVKSTGNGKVVFAGHKSGYGNCIIIAHSNGLKTLYGHLSKILVRANQEVDAGEVIAKSGNTGRSTGPHVHYEVLKDGQPINPKRFMHI